MSKIILFAHVIQLIPRSLVHRPVAEYDSDKHAKGFSTWSQLVRMLFCQFSGCNSLREFSLGLASATGNLNHLGLSRAPSKSNLAYHNARRSSELFKRLYFALYKHLGQQAGLGLRHKVLKAPIKLLDSTMISLCMNLYHWARYTRKKGGIKLHTLLDLDALMPDYVCLKEGRSRDSTAAFEVPFKPGCMVIADRGYTYSRLLKNWDSIGGSYVIRANERALFEVLESHPICPRQAGWIKSDERVAYVGVQTKMHYPDALRRLVLATSSGKMTLLSNDFQHAARLIPLSLGDRDLFQDYQAESAY